MTRREIVLIVIIMAFGTVLRLFQVATQSLWFDELLSITISRLPLNQVIFSPASIDPPLYYVLLHFWMMIGRNDYIVRLLSVVPGILGIPAIFVLGRKLFGTTVGWIAAIIFAINPYQLFYAQEARMYSLLVLFSILSLWTYARAQDFGRVRDWMLWICTMLLALYTHNFAGLLLVALDADAMWRWYQNRRHITPIVIANILIGLAFLPWFVILVQKFSWLIPALWNQPPSPLQLFMTIFSFVFGFTLDSWVIPIALVFLLAALAFIITASWEELRSKATHANRSLRLLWLTALLPLVITYLVSQWKPVYLDRLLLESSPAFYLLFAWGVVSSERRMPIRFIGLLSAPIILLALVNYYTRPDFWKPPIRETIEYVASNRTANELVVHTSGSSFLGGLFYDPLGNHILLYHPADQWLPPLLMKELSVPFETQMTLFFAEQKTLWLVVALDHIVDEQISEEREFKRSCAIASQNEIGKIRIIRCEPIR